VEELRQKIRTGAGVVVGAFTLAIASPASAQLDGIEVVSSALPTLDMGTMISNVVRGLMGLLAVIIVSKIIWSGFLLMTHGGNEDRKHAAEDSMKHAVVGLIVVASTATLMRHVVQRLFTMTGFGS